VRRWLIGVVCIACGVAGRVVFDLRAPAGDRASGALQASVLAPFFAVGLVLLSVPIVRRCYAPGEPSPRELRREWLGCLLLAVGAVVSVVAVCAGF
jgi:hypothetical protein